MFFNFKAVVFKVDELDALGFRVRFARREDRHARNGSDAVKSIFVETDDAFERVVFEDIGLNDFVVAGLANHGGDGHDDSDTSAARGI